MADAKFSFQEKARVYYPGWMSPEGKYLDFKFKFIYLFETVHKIFNNTRLL
jgi:hypothetical protein